MADTTRRASRSAALVAACRVLASQKPEPERLIDDPFAHLVVDDEALAAAAADVALTRGIELRTRYIDDAVLAFVNAHLAPRAQVLLLGAGLDARAFRLDVDADFYEVDFPATLNRKAELLSSLPSPSHRMTVPVDLASSRFVEPLLDAGFDPRHPSIAIWEGVSFYLDEEAATGVVHQLSELLSPGSQFVADYAEHSKLSEGDLDATRPVGAHLAAGAEPLRRGLADVPATLDRAGFDVVDDELVEHLPPRWGQEVAVRKYPARIFTAVRRS